MIRAVVFLVCAFLTFIGALYQYDRGDYGLFTVLMISVVLDVFWLGVELASLGE